MTLNDLEWPFHASRAISAVAELLVNYSTSLDYVLMHGMNADESRDRDVIVPRPRQDLQVQLSRPTDRDIPKTY